MTIVGSRGARYFTLALVVGSLAACASDEQSAGTPPAPAGDVSSLAPVAGNATVIDSKLGPDKAMIYTVRLDGGSSYITVTQSADFIIGNKKRVQVIRDNGGRTRIVPATT